MTTLNVDVNSLSLIRMVMVHTTLAANIGSALRAMKTMGLTQLVLVSPKHFPHPDIDALSAGASDLIDKIQVVDSLEEALADCHLVFATSSRSRSVPWPRLCAADAANKALDRVEKNANVAIVFGREDRGLTNEELALSHFHVYIPANPDYEVLNVAQAMQIICYEIWSKNEQRKQLNPIENKDTALWDRPWVDGEQMQQFYQQFEQMLISIDFLDPDHPRQLPMRIKRLFSRIQMDHLEYHLLRGVFSRVQAIVADKSTIPQDKIQDRNSDD